jgi:hypothetical protein
MHSLNELRTDTHQEISRLLSSINPKSNPEERWRDYLDIAPDQIQLSQDHIQRLALTRMFHQYSLENRVLFHLTVTYKMPKDFQYQPGQYNKFFADFYVKFFLPKLIGTRSYHTKSKRPLQPICYAFIDENESRPVVLERRTGNQVEFPLRLHHHAIVAVHPDTVGRMQTMVGENKIPLEVKKVSGKWTERSRCAFKVMTTHIRQCDAMTTLYATKQLKKYPEFLSFPDRLH